MRYISWYESLVLQPSPHAPNVRRVILFLTNSLGTTTPKKTWQGLRCLAELVKVLKTSFIFYDIIFHIWLLIKVFENYIIYCCQNGVKIPSKNKLVCLWHHVICTKVFKLSIQLLENLGKIPMRKETIVLLTELDVLR